MPSVQCSHGHGSHVVRVAQSVKETHSDCVIVVRVPAPLWHLHTVRILHNGWGQCVPHSQSFLLSVFQTWLDPIPWQEIVVNRMDDVNCRDVHNPHTECTVTVNRVLLEVSIHFVGISGKKRCTFAAIAVRIVAFRVKTNKIG